MIKNLLKGQSPRSSWHQLISISDMAMLHVWKEGNKTGYHGTSRNFEQGQDRQHPKLKILIPTQAWNYTEEVMEIVLQVTRLMFEEVHSSAKPCSTVSAATKIDI